MDTEPNKAGPPVGVNQDRELPGFSLAEVMEAQAALRSAARLPEERFALEAVIGMLSDEVQILREQGRSDEEIASLVSTGSAVKVDAAAIREHYATAGQRRPDSESAHRDKPSEA